MESVKNTEPTEKFKNGHRTSNNNSARIADGGGIPISSTLSRPDINWLQNKENRTKIEGAPGNLWISNKPLWISELSKENRGRKTVDNREKSRSVHKEKKYIVVGMRGDQIHRLHGTYRERVPYVNQVSSRESFGRDRPKPSKPKEED